MVASGKENQEGTFPAIGPVNPFWQYTSKNRSNRSVHSVCKRGFQKTVLEQSSAHVFSVCKSFAVLDTKLISSPY